MGQFDEHARLLRNERVELDAETPASGWYRTRRVKGGPYLPVYVAREGDFETVVILLDGKSASAQDIGWPYTGKNAIPQAIYNHFVMHRRWPDVDDTVREAALGDNNPPDDAPKTPEAELQAKIDAAMKGLAAYAKWGDGRSETLISSLQDGKVSSLIADDEALTRAQTLRSLLLELKGAAEKQHKVEKDPHLAAGRAVDKKWFGMRDVAEAGANALRKAMSAWETIKLQKRQAADKAAQDALDAEHAASVKAAEEEAAKTGKPAVVAWAPPPPAPAPPPAPPKIKGGSGRAASVAVITVVKDVSDWTALFQHFRLQTDVQALLIKHANAALKANPAGIVPGITTTTAADVK